MSKRETISGRLRKRVRIEQPVDTSDGAGGYIRSWNLVTTVWAEVEPFSNRGREIVVAEQVQSEVTHRIMIRYLSGVTADMRLVMDGRALNIRTVININEKNEVLVLFAQEGVAV